MIEQQDMLMLFIMTVNKVNHGEMILAVAAIFLFRRDVPTDQLYFRCKQPPEADTKIVAKVGQRVPV